MPYDQFPFPEVVIQKPLLESFSTNESENRLTGLSRLNVFIGPNNGGKSRLLRGLFADDDLIVGRSDELSGLVREGAQLLQIALAESPKEIQQPLSDFINKVKGPYPPMAALKERAWNTAFLGVPAQSFAAFVNRNTEPLNKVTCRDGRNLLAIARELGKHIAGIQGQKPEHVDVRRVYIPSLRGMRSPESRFHNR